MNYLKIIGSALVILPLVLTFAAIWRFNGFKAACGIFAVAIVLTVGVVVGTFLLCT